VNSKICIGEISHARLDPLKHSFSYPIVFAKFDLDELEELSCTNSLFSYNKFNALSFCDDDYLPGREGSVKQRALSFFDEELVEKISKVELVTVPRVFSKVFNPVSFYRLYDKNSNLCAALAEVNNTFKETHVYVLDDENREHSPSSKFVKFGYKKQFHVSPFNDLEGDYEFFFDEATSQIDLRVNIVKNGKTVFTTRMCGEPLAFDFKNMLKIIPRLFYSAHAVLPRITWEAAKLYWGKKLHVYSKPIAKSQMTIRKSGPSFLQKFAMKQVVSLLSKTKGGFLELSFPDDTKHFFGEKELPLKANIKIKNYDFFVNCLLKADVGFGESYVDGHFETKDLTSLLTLFKKSTEQYDPRRMPSTIIPRAIGYLQHVLRRNSKARSTSNIRAHYDLSNEMFSKFLDPSLTYSCGIFKKAEDDLAKAQKNKIHAMIEKAQISKDDHVLEIGCGWGGFAIEAVKSTGCRVTGITLSKEQYDLAKKRVREEGLEDRIELLIQDYRTLNQTFDKVVSIEMLEAVGHEYLGVFFKVCERVLAKDGLAALQVITIPEQRYAQYRRNCDWIQKYIFPGGHCPSLQALSNAIQKNSDFIIEDIDNIGVHYARTLREWRLKYQENKDSLKELGFDARFDRIWEYYFCYCEAGFATRSLQTLQLVLARPNTQSLPLCVGY